MVIKFLKRIALLAILILAVTVLGVVAFAHLNQPVFSKTYFWLEGKWVDNWPIYSQKWAINDLVPIMCRYGLLKPVRVEVEPHVSFLLDPRDLVPVTILRTGEWQPEIWRAMAPELTEGSVFLDVGAHIGYFSLKGAVAVGKSGRVLAFEPNPETVALLRDNVAASSAKNVTVEPIACTDHDQMLTLYAAGIINTGMSSLARNNANVTIEGPKAYTVRGRPIDDVVRELNLNRVDAIKVDVEGAELLVLKGTIETLKRFHPKLVVELVPEQLASFKATPEDVRTLIREAGYTHDKPLNSPPTDWEFTK